MPAESHAHVKGALHRGILSGRYAIDLEAQRRHMRRKGVSERKANHMEASSHVFRCKTCGAEFETPELLGAHWRAEHPEVFSELWINARRRRRK